LGLFDHLIGACEEQRRDRASETRNQAQARATGCRHRQPFERAWLDILISSSSISLQPLWRGGPNDTTGPKGRDNCCVARSDRNIAANKRTALREWPSAGHISQAGPQFGHSRRASTARSKRLLFRRWSRHHSLCKNLRRTPERDGMPSEFGKNHHAGQLEAW